MTAPALTFALTALLTRNAGAWQGTATALQTDIATDLSAEMAALDVSRFSAALRSAAPALAASGIDVQPPDGGGRHGRIWTIGRTGDVADSAKDVAVSAVPPADEVPAPIIADTPLPARLGAARADLKAALIAGNDTRTARATLARFEAEAARQAADEEAAAAEIERDRQVAIHARAAELAAAAADHLARVLAALEPPPAPVATRR